MNLGTLIENAIKQIQEEQIREKEMEEELGDDFDDDEIDSITEEDYDEFREFIEQAELTKASLNKGIEAIEAVIRSLIAEGTTKVQCNHGEVSLMYRISFVYLTYIYRV